MINRNKARALLYDAAMTGIGAALFSMSMNMFLLPADVILGGMTGIATVISMFFPVPVGLTIIVLNIPLMIANTRLFGRGFLWRTLIGVMSTSLATDLVRIFPVTVTDPLICALFGGVAMGASVGLLLSRGFTTGGTDLIACLIKHKFKRLSTGSIIMLADLAIIIGASFFTRSFDGIFYSFLCIFAAGKVTDLMLSGARRAGQAFIITARPDELVAAIFKRLDRGVTMLDGCGGFTGEPKRVIMCVVSKRELFYLKQLIFELDPQAFVVIADAAEVSGEGFAQAASAQ